VTMRTPTPLGERTPAAKYVWRGGRFRASRDLGASTILSDLVATAYARRLPALDLGRLLDLGCGAAPLAPLYGHADAVVHADIERRSSVVLPFVGLDAGRALPFRDASFDTVIVSDVLEHLPTPDLAVREAARILRPGGALIGNTPYLYWLHEEPYDYWRPSRHALEHTLLAAGFVGLDIEVLGGSVEVVTDLVAKHVAAAAGWARPIGGLVARVGASWSVSRTGRRAAEVTGGKFPMGHFFLARRPDRQTIT
jgi:SAM-dependent methyltransferase